MNDFDLAVSNPAYSKLLPIAVRLNMAESTAEITNSVLDMSTELKGKPTEANVVAYNYANAAIVASLTETAEGFARIHPEKLNEMAAAIASEWNGLKKILNNRSGTYRPGLGYSVSYLRNFEDEVRSAETPEAFRNAMAKMRKLMEDTTGVGSLALHFAEKGLAEMLVKYIIPDYILASPEDDITACLYDLWLHLERLIGATTFADIFVLNVDDTKTGSDGESNGCHNAGRNR